MKKATPSHLTPKQVDHTLCGPPVKEVPVPPEVSDLIKKFPEVFSAKLPDGLPPQRDTDHKIEIVPGSKPPARRIYRMSPAEEMELKLQLEDHLRAGRLRPSVSPYGAGTLFASKKDGGLRLCIDYRWLNRITVPNRYPLPRIDELIDKLKGARYFSKLDLSQGFHQIRIAAGDEHKTAFQTKFGSFEWTVMPFGLSNAPATFQMTMDKIFADISDFTDVYIDDIVIFSNSLEEHLEHLKQVFERLNKNNLYVKPSKCAWAQPEIEFVGFIVGQNGVRPIPQKLQVINNWPVPRNVKNIRSFLGVCGFYHRFLPSFATLATPMTNLLHKKSKKYQVFYLF